MKAKEKLLLTLNFKNVHFDCLFTDFFVRQYGRTIFDIKNLKLAIFKVLSLLEIKNRTYYRLYMETFFSFAV